MYIIPLICLLLSSLVCGLNAAPSDYQHESANYRTGDCRIERPSIPVFLGIVFGTVLGGFSFALWAIKFDNSRPRLCDYLGTIGIGCAELGLLFLIMIALHPYTWGLPPQWLPAKLNPCPADYRDYFPHGQLFEGKKPDIPLVESSFKKAPREARGDQGGLPF